MQHQKWTEGKDNGNIYQFKQGDHQKCFQEIPKSSGGHGWSQWQFLWINLIYRFESEATWEDEWRPNLIITKDHTKHEDVNYVIGFHQYEPALPSDWHPNILKSIYCFWCECQLVQLTIYKFQKKQMASWFCFPHWQYPTDISLLHSRQNLKQMKLMWNW